MNAGYSVRHVDMLRDTLTGKSKGCAMVQFEGSAVQAQEAMKAMNDSELKGRLIFIREDRVDANLASPSWPLQSNIPSRSHNRQCFVGRLPLDITWQQLKHHFSQSLVVERVEVMVHPNGVGKGYGTARFTTGQDALKAVNLFNNSVIGGTPIQVKLDRKA